MDIARVEKKIKAGMQHVQASPLGSAYATMKSLSGKKRMMNQWMDDVTRCIASGGESCAAVKVIPKARNGGGNVNDWVGPVGFLH